MGRLLNAVKTYLANCPTNVEVVKIKESFRDVEIVIARKGSLTTETRRELRPVFDQILAVGGTSVVEKQPPWDHNNGWTIGRIALLEEIGQYKTTIELSEDELQSAPSDFKAIANGLIYRRITIYLYPSPEAAEAGMWEGHPRVVKEEALAFIYARNNLRRRT